jgi:hypothetical protein
MDFSIGLYNLSADEEEYVDMFTQGLKSLLKWRLQGEQGFSLQFQD